MNIKLLPTIQHKTALEFVERETNSLWDTNSRSSQAWDKIVATQPYLFSWLNEHQNYAVQHHCSPLIIPYVGLSLLVAIANAKADNRTILVENDFTFSPEDEDYHHIVRELAETNSSLLALINATTPRQTTYGGLSPILTQLVLYLYVLLIEGI